MPGMRAAGPRSKVTKGTLRNSILDGASHSAMLGLTRNYVVPFALTLQATTAQIGLLVSVPNLTMALSQLAAPALVARAGSRKRLILPTAFVGFENVLLALPAGVTRRDGFSASAVLRPATVDCYGTVRHTRIPPVLDDS